MTTDETADPADEGTVLLEREFAAPREAVWQAFTDPDEFAAWFGPDGVHVPRESIELDLRAGGHWRYRMDTADGSPGHRVQAVFTSVIDGEMICAREHFDMADGTSATLRTRFEFVDLDDGRTLLRITQGSHGKTAGPARQAWRETLDRLSGHLARRVG